MQQKIFVTGGTGFLGSYLLRYLVHQGYKNIYALKRPSSKLDLVTEVAHQINWLEGDILDFSFLEEAMQGMDQVYHCAAMISFLPKEADKMMQINETGTANIVNLALHHQVKKLVYISSIAAIGKETGDDIISEKTKWKNDKTNSNYAKSKYAAEMQVWRGIAEGLNAAILNPSIILGSGFWNGGSTKIFELYGKGFPFYVEGSNGYVDVRDVAKMAILLMESDISGERFLVNAENLSYKKVFTEISNCAKVKPPYLKITPLLGAIGWRVQWIVSKLTCINPTITKETLNSALGKSSYNNQKSLAAFNFKYTPISETITETTSQFVAAKKEGMKPMSLPLN